MAQYLETVYASDSWMEQYTNSEQSGISRAELLTSQENFSFLYEGIPHSVYAESESWIRVHYPTSGQYKKKNLVRARQYVYVTGKDSSASGSLQSGRYVFGYQNGIAGVFFFDAVDPMAPELDDLPQNQYVQIGDLADGDIALTSARNGFLEMTPNVWVGCTGSMRSGSRYTANASMQIQSHLGANRPYVIYTYEDVSVDVRDCAPSSGFVNEKEDAVFRWRFEEYSRTAEQIVQQAAYQFRWRVSGESSYQESTVTSGMESHTVPAGTFPESGSIDWCVRVQSDDGVWSDWSSWMTLTTQDSLSAPSGLSPDMSYVDGNLPQQFSWRHTIATGTAQSAFELQYRTSEEEDWQELAAAQTQQTSVLLPQDTLPTGKGEWRVRTANSDGVWGDWSEIASVIVRARPLAPSLGQIDPAPKPCIRWQAQDQQGYQVQVGPVDSGQRYGDEKEWRCPEFLPDGSYQVGVRIQNRFGLWSEWVQTSIQVQNHPEGEIQLLGRASGCGISLTWDAAGDFAGYLVRRDGTKIAQVDACAYTDRLCWDKHRYEVLGEMANGHYVSSGVVTLACRMDCAALCGLEEEDEWIFLQVRRDSVPEHRLEQVATVTYQHYDGMTLPQAQTNGSQDRRHHFLFSLPDRRQVEKLLALTGQSVIYKDPWGYCLTGVLEQLEVAFAQCPEIAFSIVETERREVHAD